MGWLDKGFKNIFKGAKDMLNSPVGLLALGVAAPYLSSYLASSTAAGSGSWMANIMKAEGMKGALARGVGSPMVSNALKNAALNYGIASLTGSEHPERSAMWAGAASMPFTYMQGAQAAKQYNQLANIGDKKNWYDFALGNVSDPITTQGPSTFKDILSAPQTAPQYDQSWAAEFAGPTGYTDIPGTSEILGTREIPGVIDTKSWADAGINMDYFTRDPGELQRMATQPGGIGALPAAFGLENVNIMSTLIPQVAGLYGGRMSDEEIWEKQKERRIRSWAHRYGIPYEEAKEIWKHGWRNPYYTTQTPGDYGRFANRGGYIDDYTAGGKAVGPGTGTSDSIQPVALSNGEFVFTEKATNNFPGGADGLYSLMNRLDPESETAQEARV
jgi:hypothetical protein